MFGVVLKQLILEKGFERAAASINAVKELSLEHSNPPFASFELSFVLLILLLDSPVLFLPSFQFISHGGKVLAHHLCASLDAVYLLL